MTVLPVCHWQNLLEWCRLICHGKALKAGGDGALLPPFRRLPFYTVVEAATNLAGRAKSWDEVVIALEAFRPVAGAFDKEWLVNCKDQSMTAA